MTVLIEPVSLARITSDVVAGVLKLSRPDAPPTPRQIWEASELWPGGVEMDSLERLDAASAVDLMFDVRSTGLEDLLLARRTISGWSDIVAHALARADPAVTFETSGTTGAPERHVQPLAELIAEVDAATELFDGRTRIICAVPLRHIYGFIWAGLAPSRRNLAFDSLVGSAPSAWPSKLRGGDVLVATPTLLSRATARPWPSGVDVLSSTGPLPAETWRALMDAGAHRVREIYGSTETGGVGLRSAPDAPFKLAFGWTRASEDRIAKTGREARDPPDFWRWRDDMTFEVAGRRDRIVKVAGERVSLDAVRAALTDHPDVADAAVRLMRPEEGERVKAFVALKAGTEPAVLRAALDAWLRDRLPAFARPAAIAFGSRLPTTPEGKPADWPVI